MDKRHVVQCFRGELVRFYRATFGTEMDLRAGNDPLQKLQVQTYAVPLADFCNATGCGKAVVTRHFEALKETFQGLFTTKTLPNIAGKSQSGIIVAHEMVIGLASSLSASRIAPLSRARVIDFQRWMLQLINLIRKGHLNFTEHRFNVFKDAPPEWVELLSYRSGRMLAMRVRALAKKEGISLEHAYRRLNQMRGGNVLTKKGIPRKTRNSR